MHETKGAFVVPTVIAVAVVIIGAGASAAVFWWRQYFRRMFDARFRSQDDGSYLVLWTRGRGRPIEVYRIDAEAKERALACLIRGSVVSTGLFVGLIIAAVAINVLWPLPVMIPALFGLTIVAFVPQRRATRKAGCLIVAGIRVEAAEKIAPPGPPPEASARSLRLIILVSCLIAALGGAIGMIFVLDPESSEIAWTVGQTISLILLLVVLPLSVALINWWVLRRMRS